jgi:iron complex transport system ATP-binding protein
VTLLRGEGLHARHRGAEREALRDVWLGIDAGELVALVGPNGSGKSTLLATLGRHLDRTAGRLLWRDVEIPRRGSRRAWARQVAFLPQEPQAPAGISVEALVGRGRHPHRPTWSGESPTDRAAVARALRLLDLLEVRNRSVETLSGGERRRAWLAMVLAQEAQVLLLDEPMSGLDLAQRLEVEGLLRRLVREENKAILVVLHDLTEALRCADRVAVVHRGRLYVAGAPEAVLSSDTLLDVFRLDARIEQGPEGLRLAVQGPARGARFL